MADDAMAGGTATGGTGEVALPEIGDMVLYAPDCVGDACEHPAGAPRPAIVRGVHADGTADLTVFQAHSVATLADVRHDADGAARSWRHRPGRETT